MSSKPAIHLLTGCTAVGKTELALRWAEQCGAEIVSCDSLLFYRGMDIGTAKPTREELARVPHHLIDICEPDEPMNIARYLGLARETVRAVVARHRPVLVTGGSGFYLKAFLSPVADQVAVSDALRREVAALSEDDAVTRLRGLNPEGLGTLDTANPRRVLRALERCLASGRTLEELRRGFAAQPSAFADYDVKLTELVRAPDELETRIARRVALMLQAGLVAEVESLCKRNFMANPSAAGAIGYREVLAMLQGNLAKHELAGKIAANTRALVKKQRTWFRTQIPAHTILDATVAKPEQLFLS